MSQSKPAEPPSVRRSLLLGLAIGVSVEAVLLPLAFLILSHGDPPLDVIEAMAMASQCAAYVFFKVVDPPVSVLWQAGCVFTLQSSVYSAIAFAILHGAPVSWQSRANSKALSTRLDL